MDENNKMFWNSDVGVDKDEVESDIDCTKDPCETDEGYLFVNSHRIKEEHIKEFYFSSLRSASFIIWCTASVLVVIGVILNTVFSGFDLLWTCAGALWAFYPIFRIYVCLRSIRLYKMRLKEFYGGEFPLQKYCFLEDCFINEEDRSHKTFYVNIKKVILTKNLILLRTGSKLNHIIPRDSFTKGNEKEFLDFMRGKGIRVKGK